MSLIKHYLHQKMTETTDKIIDRDALQDNMIQQILDDMDIKTMMAILYDNMSESYDKYSVDELIAEVEEYYPHLLEDSDA
jgi:arginine/lysine/ornithine decarboxylase